MVLRRPPDIVGTFALHPPDGNGRPRAKLDGYRPDHEVRPGELNGGQHIYPGSGRIEPGTAGAVEVSFLFPAQMGAWLWPGKRVRVWEGATVVGTITVDEVLSAELDVRTATRDASFASDALGWSQWADARGGYQVPFDPRPLIHRVAASPLDATGVWGTLWEKLYHQGDIGLASLLTVPLLAALRAHTGVPDWNVYALACAIEEARLRDGTHELPGLHFSRYTHALSALARLALDDLALDDTPELVQSALAVVAFARGLPTIGAMVDGFTEDERQEILRDHRGW
jgi:hypothetical protein